MAHTKRTAVMLGPFLVLAIASAALAADTFSNEDALKSTLSRVLPANAVITGVKSSSTEIRIVGRAVAHEQVAEFMRGLATVARTRNGLGRIVQRTRDGLVRVALFNSGHDVLLELPVAEAPGYDVELMRADGARKGVDFELRLR